MFPFIYSYALSQPALRAEALRISNGTSLNVTIDNMGGVPAADQKAIRALVLPEKYTYAAAMWYLWNECKAEMVIKLAEGGLEAFKEYIVGCINTPVGDDRVKKWCSVVKALKPEGMGMPEGCSLVGEF